MLRGNAVHQHLETYLLEGTLPDNTPEGKIAKAGLHLLPARDASSQHVELSLDELPIPDLPVPFKGFIDLYIEGDIPEVLDHKTTSNFKYALTEEGLSTDIQLIIYAAHVLANCSAEEVKLTHVCYLTKTPYIAQRTSTIVCRNDVTSRFNEIVETAQEMLTASMLPVTSMEKDKGHCWAYGKRCPYYDECQRTTRNKGILNMGDQHLSVLNKLRGETPTTAPTTKEPVVLYVNCAVLGEQLTPLSEGLRELIDRVCENKKASHIALIPYNEGYHLLSALIEAEGIPPGDYYAHGRSPLYSLTCDALHKVADRVVMAQ